MPTSRYRPQAHLLFCRKGSCTVRRRGFTLIELLVVIAVIAVLLAILMPVASTARERGQRAVCLSNLRQLTMAWIQYANEHDSKLVMGDAFSMAIAGPNYRLESWLGRPCSHVRDRRRRERPHGGRDVLTRDDCQ